MNQKMQKTYWRAAAIGLFACFVLLLPFFSQQSNAVSTDSHIFPRTANYFLKWELSSGEAEELAKWDVVVLDMEAQKRRPDLLRKMRQLNPDIVLLVYITPQEIVKTHASSFSQMRQEFGAGIDNSWYLTDSSGKKLSWWSGTYLLNVTSEAPRKNGERFQEYLVDFVVEDLLGSGLWDGVYYDNTWDNVTWFTGSDVDINKNGQVSNNADAAWRAGMKYIYEETRNRTGNKYAVVGNGTTREYSEYLNGKMLENFQDQHWASTMQTYAHNEVYSPNPQLQIINANTSNGQKGGQTSYKSMRFGLGSTLMGDGYYSYDYGDTNHGQLWWYDEFSSNLGDPLGQATSQTGKTSFVPDIWSRSFENGIALVNSKDTAGTIDLGGEYEAIRGLQDPTVNNGAIVSEVTLGAQDGRVLLKTFETLMGTLYTNGSFVRFFRPDGTRVRNGFFAFDDAYEGGYQIAKQDMNNDDVPDLFVSKRNKVQAWRSDGQPFYTIYPYTARYRGTLRMALGDITGNGRTELIIAPGFGDTEGLPIKVYTVDGLKAVADWYPFGKNYRGGYSVAIGDVDADPFGELIVGAGPGNEPRVGIYTHNLTAQSSFLAFERGFRGGVNIATGNIEGNGQDQIVVGPGKGGKPYISVYTGKAEQVGKTFISHSTLDAPGIDVRTVDVDFDGKDDIVGMSADF